MTQVAEVLPYMIDHMDLAAGKVKLPTGKKLADCIRAVWDTAPATEVEAMSEEGQETTGKAIYKLVTDHKLARMVAEATVRACTYAKLSGADRSKLLANARPAVNYVLQDLAKNYCEMVHGVDTEAMEAQP